MRRAVALALVLTAAACGGPKAGVEVGVKEINTDVLIGPQRPRVVPAPPAASPPRPSGFPGFVQPPVTVLPPPPTPPPSCPQASPIAPIEQALTAVATVPPPEASYAYRNTGTWSVGDRHGAYPAVSTRSIMNVRNPAQGGGFAFDVSIPDPSGTTTTTTYRVYPSQTGPVDPTPGIYIEQVVSRAGETVTDTFTPVPAVLLMQFPAEAGKTWSSRGVDPTTQTVMQFNARIVARSIVDACGTRLAAWTVDVTEGIIRSPTADLTFAATLSIAPQYGGLVVADKVVQQGTISDSVTGGSLDTFAENRARITRAPRHPAG